MFKTRLQVVAAGMFCLAVFAGVTLAAENASFLDQAVEMHRAQIQIGQIGIENAQDSRVREFARSLVRDHSAALHDLQIARSTGRPLGSVENRPQGDLSHEQNSKTHDAPVTREKPMRTTMDPTDPSLLTSDHQQSLDRLAGLSGAAFDREFMNIVVKEHRKGVESFEHEAALDRKDTGSSLSAQIAAAYLPKLRAHLTDAGEIQKQLGDR